MSEPGIKLSKTKVSQTIDLSDIVGKDISGDPLLVRQIGQGIIDYLLERVGSGRGINGVKLKSPYSADYADSLEFKASGKVKSEVNMRLSGDMLGSLDFTDNGSEITLTIDDPEQAIKAYAHQTGFEGHPTIKGPRRPFFGLSEREVNIVLRDFKEEIENVDAALPKDESQFFSVDVEGAVESGIKRFVSDLFK